MADGLLKITNAFRSGKVVMFTGVPTGGWLGEGSVIKTELRAVTMRPTRVVHIPRAAFRWLLDTSTWWVFGTTKKEKVRLAA